MFVGYGHRVYVIEPKKQLASEIFLGTCCGYFGAFYTVRITCWSPLATVFCGLRPTVGSCGVRPILASMVSMSNPWMTGWCKVRANGTLRRGWKPFVLRLDSGELVGD